MAHTFRNLGFEDAGHSSGLADGWTFDQLASLELFAEYGPDIPGAPTELFEGGWLENEDYDFVFAGLLVDVFPAIYTTSDSFEAFEAEWLNNQFFAFDIDSVSIAVASYDAGTPQDFEDFEEEWDTNESYLFVFVGIGTDLTAASYDTSTPEDFEDFEDEWDGFAEMLEVPAVLFEKPSTTVEFIAPDTIVRTTGDFRADGCRAGNVVNFFPGAVSNLADFPVESVTALSMIVGGTAVVNEGPLATTFGNMEFAVYEVIEVDESFEGTWTAMSTAF